jgi:hypothetical protein
MKGSTRSTKKIKNKIKSKRETPTRPRLVSNHHTVKKERKIRNHEKKTKSKLISHQDQQSLKLPPHMTLMVPAQNMLHLSLIKRAGVSRVFDHIPLPRKKFQLIN